jgi:hypothetical protein
MRSRFRVFSGVVMIVAGTASLWAVRGLIITPMPPSDIDTCFQQGTAAWHFTANWKPILVDGKPWPVYVVDATNCGRARMVDCHGSAECSAPITCAADQSGTAVKVLPYNVRNAAGAGVRTSTWPTGPGRKPPVCKATP